MPEPWARRGRRWLAVLVALAAAATFIGSPVTAQTDGDPTPTLEGATLAVETGETRRVVATYRIDVASGDGRTGSASTVTGTIWQFPDREVRGLSASVDGTAVEPSVTRGERHVRVTVPIPEAARRDTVVVEMTYRVSGPPGRLRTPLWVPTVEPPGGEEVVRLTVTLPEGTGVTGTAIPHIDSVTDDGLVLDYRLSHVPGFVAVGYGQEGRAVPLDALVAAGGATVVFGSLTAWTVYTRRRATGGVFSR